MKTNAAKHLFPGSNTKDGFIGYFDNLFNPNKLKRLFILKGGPGTGKSSLMKRVGVYAESIGYSVEYFHCASDSDSLDAIIITEAGVAVADGTFPHILDPKLPMSADEIINLAEGLDKQKLDSSKSEIKRLNKECSRCFLVAHTLSSAASEIIKAINYSYVFDTAGITKTLEPLYDLIEKGSGMGSERHVFLSALTPDGVMKYYEDIFDVDIYAIKAPWGTDMTFRLKQLSDYALLHNNDVMLCHNAINANVIDSIKIGKGIFITTSPELFAFAKEGLDLSEYIKEKNNIDPLIAKYSYLIEAAATMLFEARITHQKLEELYINAMDFNICDTAFERIVNVV